jgi:hypothetical protein
MSYLHINPQACQCCSGGIWNLESGWAHDTQVLYNNVVSETCPLRYFLRQVRMRRQIGPGSNNEHREHRLEKSCCGVCGVLTDVVL